MANDLYKAHLLVEDTGFIGIVQMAVAKVALDVFAETPRDEQRRSLARTMLLEWRDPDSQYMNAFLVIVAADAGIRAAAVTGTTVNALAITDASVIPLVANAWNPVAGGQ